MKISFILHLYIDLCIATWLSPDDGAGRGLFNLLIDLGEEPLRSHFEAESETCQQIHLGSPVAMCRVEKVSVNLSNVHRVTVKSLTFQYTGCST